MDAVKVIISNDQKAVKVPTGIRMLIRRCCHAVLQLEGFKGSAEVSVRFVDNEQIRELNKQYRNIDKETDVLSFPMFEKDELVQKIKEKSFEHEDVLGDIVISIPKVEEQAKEYGHSFERELSYMVVHGFYHLMGYDHIKEEDKKEMRPKEEKILNDLKIIRK